MADGLVGPITWREVVELYRLTFDYEVGRNTEPRYNIAPTQTVPFVVRNGEGNHALKEGRWNLVPWWAKDMPRQMMINARIAQIDFTINPFKLLAKTVSVQSLIMTEPRLVVSNA